MSDLSALVWAHVYIAGVGFLAEASARWGLSPELSRKLFQVGAGLWAIGAASLFESRYLAALPALTALLAIWELRRRGHLAVVQVGPDSPGTRWFFASFVTLVVVAWDVKAAVVGGVLAMALGDTVAAIAGRRWGRWRYPGLGAEERSVEGSLAMLAVTFLVLLETLQVYEAERGLPWLAGLAALAAVAATCAEALGEKGLDNLWVPLTAGLVLALGLGRIPPEFVVPLGVGSLLAALIALVALRWEALSPSGALGAVVTGTLVFGLSGWAGGLALAGFFVAGSVLSRQFRHWKQDIEAEYAKTGARDLGQVLANGGVTAAAAVGWAATGQAAWMGALLGSLAAASADTWATEVGVRSRRPPVLITTLRPVPAGTSGGVTLAGSAAALHGALLVGVIAALADSTWWPAVPWVVLAGLAGSIVDSLLGATVQGVYWCPECEKETERRQHRCGAATRLHRGLAFVSNDLVNLLATLAGALVGYLAL